ncbi:MAG: tetratricopeptide repeat protein [Blastocatellia bacterium]
MELLYNPERMPEEEIKATFVAREKLVDELVSLIESQPDGAGMQHVVIIAPRGMGKTTVMLMVKFALKDRGLTDRWQAVKFPEESYGIYDLADFWIETLSLIAADTADTELQRLADNLKTEFPKNDELQEAAYAALKDWRRKHNKRLLLLVENFDLILGQINDERDNARLRDALMNDGTMMFIGGATTFFREARAYDEPLYNFFKIYDLADLKFEQMQELLRRRAAVDRISDFEARLKANTSRLRSLEYFTGGSPRLALMLYRVVSQSDVTEVRRALEKLLDEVTPYYKAKIETLPAQQRKILDHIARVSGKTGEGLTPTEIAEAVRLSPNQVSAQLKRLAELGYVRAANLRGRSSYYTLSEPLYAIWHQMRFGRDARQRMLWLINFLKVWYAAEEMGTESERLNARFRDHRRADRMREARDTLEHHSYLAEAMEDDPVRARAMDGVIRGYLELDDDEIVRNELLDGIKLEDLSEETLVQLGKVGCISEEQIKSARAARSSSALSSQQTAMAELKGLAAIAYFLRKKSVDIAFYYDRAEIALRQLDRALEIKPDDYDAWRDRGIALYRLGRWQEAVASYDRAIEINPDDGIIWRQRAWALKGEPYAFLTRPSLKRYSTPWKWAKGASVPVKEMLQRYEEAITSYDRFLKIEPHNADVWVDRGRLLSNLERYEEAIASYDRVLEIDTDYGNAWYLRAEALSALGRYKEAIASYDRELDIHPDSHYRWNRSEAFDKWISDVIASYDRTLVIDPYNLETWYYRLPACLSLFASAATQGKLHLAGQFWNEALKTGSRSGFEKWLDALSEAALEVARSGQLGFVRELLAESKLEEQLFPLARAIDYLQTEDEALIEKLSPEVRGIVEKVVAKLKETTQAGA